LRKNLVQPIACVHTIDAELSQQRLVSLGGVESGVECGIVADVGLRS
jgi:hypothetical protein